MTILDQRDWKTHSRNQRGDMAEWMAIAQWQDCAKLARPGIVFEIRNADGQVLITPCTPALPALPHDWKSPPLEFRAVVEARPERSAPLPAPRE